MPNYFNPIRSASEKHRPLKNKLGRTHKTKNGEYEDRVIDIDILLYDDLHLNHSQLVIPHPHIAKRPFVYQPLCDILSKKHFRTNYRTRDTL